MKIVKSKYRHQGFKALSAQNLDTEAKMCFANTFDTKKLPAESYQNIFDVIVTYTKTNEGQQNFQIQIAIYSETNGRCLLRCFPILFDRHGITDI